MQAECDRSDDPNLEESLRLETILTELKRKKRALESAIAALERLQDQRRPGTRTSKGTKSAVRAARCKRRIPEIAMQTAAGSGRGQLIPFPGAKRSGKVGQGSEEVKA
jgi:hypothetical protein